jgi:hypothetical protein
MRLIQLTTQYSIYESWKHCEHLVHIYALFIICSCLKGNEFGTVILTLCISSYLWNIAAISAYYVTLPHILLYRTRVLFTMELYCTPKSQHTTVKHSQELLEHTYMSDLYGLGTLTPIEFFQQDLLWQSSNTHSHSCSQKVSKQTSGLHLHTTTAPRRIVHH